MTKRSLIYLIDLPTFPKGVISLSFPAIAACIPKSYTICYRDLNQSGLSKKDLAVIQSGQVLFAGLKVSSQNYKLAIALTQNLKLTNPGLPIVWGGEYPTLLPQEAAKYADTIESGAFESISDELLEDIKNAGLKAHYGAVKKYVCSNLRAPDFSILPNKGAYLQTMGMPLETSRGCDKKCTFCMVHTMQPVSNFKSPKQLNLELNVLKGKFVNVVDYNLGVDKQHLDKVIDCFTKSEVAGWMGEMCLETLDDDRLLLRLAKSRCRIIYCGLESVNPEALKSINKAKTNNIDNYARIIKKVQAHGIQLAAGIIIGLEGATKKTIDDTFKYFTDLGIIYAKLTFLTYNPGTKVFQSMKRVGTYLSDNAAFFDGNHFTFLPHGVNKEEVLEALSRNIKTFYALNTIRKRGRQAGLSGLPLQEFIAFNLVYRDTYLKWLKYIIFKNENAFDTLLNRPFKKSKALVAAENKIVSVRKKRMLLAQ